MKQFLNTAETMTEFGISEASARSLVRGVRDNIPERYHESDIVGHYKCSVRAVALMDFSRYGDNLETAPAYKPSNSNENSASVTLSSSTSTTWLWSCSG